MSKSKLKTELEACYKEFHQGDFLFSDPVGFVHRYHDPLDQEIVSFVAALLAYGNVKQILRSVELFFGGVEKSGHSPRSFFDAYVSSARSTADPIKLDFPMMKSFKHRFHIFKDFDQVFRSIARDLVKHYPDPLDSNRKTLTLGHFFIRNHRSLTDSNTGIEPTLIDAISRLEAGFEPWARKSIAMKHLIPNPKRGGTCKRLLMWFRWMVRFDAIDLGLWSTQNLPWADLPNIRRSELLIPLDVHMGRAAMRLKLTTKKTMNWNTVLEVTSNLRLIDPNDPTRFDFALTRLGILKKT